MPTLYVRIKQGDTLSSIAQRYSIASPDELYNHELNAGFRNKNPNMNIISPESIIRIPEELRRISGEANRENIIQSTDWIPLFDSHMHFQSNNCCPIPLQWAVAYKKSQATLGGVLTGNVRDRTAFKNRITLNSEAVHWPGKVLTRRLGALGRLRTDLVGGIYWRETQDSHFPADNAWTVNGGDGSTAKLSHMTEETEEATGRAEDTLKGSYYQGVAYEQISVGLLMDLSYSHYWGDLGLPINLPIMGKRYFINDFCRIPITLTGVNCYSTFEEYYYPENSNTILASLVNESDTTLLGAYSSQNSNNSRTLNISVSGLDLELLKKDFVHIVTELPGEENHWAEEYPLQILHSEGIAVKFPLSQFIFYHYDPRRHYLSERDRVAEIADILNIHSFIKIIKEDNYNIRLEAVEELNSEGPFMDLREHTDGMVSHQEGMNQLVIHEGLFWGIKMYPRLGYHPDELVSDVSDQYRYPHLRELYNDCSTNRIPIIAHCSRMGMSIADYSNYYRYRSPNYDSGISNEEAEYKFADDNTSPEAWEDIINDYPNLMLCLAHFGGYEEWERVCEIRKSDSYSCIFETIYETYDRNACNLPSGQDATTDAERAAIFYHWIVKIPEMMEKDNNLFVDISFFKDDLDTIETRNNFVWLLTQFPILKRRILIGTDWYMTEQWGTIGHGELLTNLYSILNPLTRIMEFDVWHQFSVLNPMVFMGLADQGECDISNNCNVSRSELGVVSKSQIGETRLNIYGERIIEKMHDPTFRQTACALPSNIYETAVNISRIIEGFKMMSLRNSEDLYYENL